MWICLNCWSRNITFSFSCCFCLALASMSIHLPTLEDINITVPLCAHRELEKPFLFFAPKQEQQSCLKTFVDIYDCPSCQYVNPYFSKTCTFCNEDPDTFYYRSGHLSGIQPSTSSYQPGVQVKTQRLRNNLQEINLNLSKCIKRRFFVDGSFGLKYCSLATSPNIKKFKNINWCRPDEIKYKISTKLLPWTVFPNRICPFDIIQGNLGNCWIAGTLASLAATRPDLIKRQILTKSYNEEGVYALQYYIDGIWQSIVIDDMLPCDIKGNVAFGQVKNKQLFFPLIEKGLAKSRGSYQALEGGRPAEAFNIMTGLPCTTLEIPHSGSNRGSANLDIWNEIIKSKQAGYPMVVSSGQENNEKFEKVSLDQNHAYSILDVREEKLDGKRGKLLDCCSMKLLKLYNPWGRSSWKGDWSDLSRLWSRNPNLKGLLNPNLNLSNEGKFWISFHDFSNYFVCVDICKARDDWIITHKFGTFPQSIAGVVIGFILIVNEHTEIDLNLYQQLSKQKTPVDVCVAIYLAHEDEHGRLHRGALVASSKRQMRKHLSCDSSLSPGKYIVIPFAFNHLPTDQFQHVDINPDSYVLALHSSCRVSLDLYTFDLSSSGQNWSEALIEMVIKKGKMRINKNNTRYYTLSDNGTILVFENPNPHDTALVLCCTSISENIWSSRGLSHTVDTVPPLHRMLVTIVGKRDRNQPITADYKLQVKVDTVPGNTDLRKWNLSGKYHVPAFASPVDLHQPRPLNLCS